MNWSVYLRRHIIPMHLCAKSSAIGWDFRKHAFKWVCPPHIYIACILFRTKKKKKTLNKINSTIYKSAPSHYHQSPLLESVALVEEGSLNGPFKKNSRNKYFNDCIMDLQYSLSHWLRNKNKSLSWWNILRIDVSPLKYRHLFAWYKELFNRTDTYTYTHKPPEPEADKGRVSTGWVK